MITMLLNKVLLLLLPQRNLLRLLPRRTRIQSSERALVVKMVSYLVARSRRRNSKLTKIVREMFSSCEESQDHYDNYFNREETTSSTDILRSSEHDQSWFDQFQEETRFNIKPNIFDAPF